MGEATGEVSTAATGTGDSSMMRFDAGDVSGVEGSATTGLRDSAVALAAAGDATNDVLVEEMIASGVPGKLMMPDSTGEPGASGEAAALDRAMAGGFGTPPGKRMTV